MSAHYFWRCRMCGNVVAKPEREDKPTKCYNCRTGGTAAGDRDLYERLVSGLSEVTDP